MNQFRYNVLNNTDQFFWVLQRYYVNMNTYDKSDLVRNLFKVYKNKNVEVPRLDALRRQELSKEVTPLAQNVLSSIADTASSITAKFFFPNATSGLFPAAKHFYIVSVPGKHRLLKVTGVYQPSSTTPYVDFITVNQNTTATDNGIPFYDFIRDDGAYELYVATSDVSLEEIQSKFNTLNPIVLRYQEDNQNPMLIFRIITYSTSGIAQFDKRMTPQETKNGMGSLYPEIKISDEDWAHS